MVTHVISYSSPAGDNVLHELTHAVLGLFRRHCLTSAVLPKLWPLGSFSPSSTRVGGKWDGDVPLRAEPTWRQGLAAPDLLLIAELVGEGSSLKSCWEGLEKEGGRKAGMQAAWGVGASRAR